MPTPAPWRRRISWRLVIYVLVPALLLLSIAAVMAAYRSRLAVSELYDRQMERSANIMLAFLQHEYSEEQTDEENESEPLTPGQNLEQDAEQAPNQEIAVIIGQISARQTSDANYRIYLDATLFFSTPDVAALPRCDAAFSAVDGPTPTAESAWRCYKKSEPSAGRQGIEIEIFDRMQRRELSTRELLYSVFLPFLLLPLLLVLSVFGAVRRGLLPLRKVSTEIATRSVGNLQALPTQALPLELAPVVSAVNGLLDGVRHGLAREQRLSDDAAHELRTPLTSMSMLEQLMRRENRDERLRPHLDGLQQSIARSQRMVDQLLLFARLQSAQQLSTEPLLLRELIEQQLGDLSPLITDKELSVALDLGQDYFLNGNRDAMDLLLRNVIGNAVKYSPHGGQLIIFRERRSLYIEDTGPGVADAARARVFDRFYRNDSEGTHSGSGLGLSLAKRVADQHSFSLSCGTPLRGTGGSFVLSFS